MICDDENYLNTFDTTVVQAYIGAKQTPTFHMQFLNSKDPYFIDHWKSEHGDDYLNDHKGHKSSFDNVILGLRSFYSPNCGGLYVTIPSLRKSDVNQFINDHNALDIVSKKGKSIRGMSRKEIAMNNGEFFTVPSTYTKKIGARPEYFRPKIVVKKEYVETTFKTIMKFIVRMASKKIGKGKKLWRSFVKNFPKIFRNEILDKSLTKMDTIYSMKDGIEKKFSSYDVLKMFYIDSIDRETGVSFPIFKENLITKLMSTFGREFQAWLSTLWSKLRMFYTKMDSNNRYGYNNDNINVKKEKNDEKRFIASDLHRVITKNHKHLFHDFSTICYAKTSMIQKNRKRDSPYYYSIGSTIEHYVMCTQKDNKNEYEMILQKIEQAKKKAKTRSKRSQIFNYNNNNDEERMNEDIGTLMIGSQLNSLNCIYCGDVQCQSSKIGNKAGEYLKSSNDSMLCPHEVFQEKLNNDEGFKNAITRVKKAVQSGKLKNKKTIVIGRRIQPFDKTVHYMPKKGLSTIGEMMSTNNTKGRYFNDSNLIQLGQDKFKVIEHRDESIPHIMFFLEVPQ